MSQQHNKLTLPIYQLDSDGSILPNPAFHRPWNKLHSRTIEYPFAASQIHDAQTILDVGSVKADEAWITWLESLPIEVHTTDYDNDVEHVFRNSKFHQADVRELAYDDDYFDVILAVSVIEHIGLESPQVNQEVIPDIHTDGDIDAVRELVRVLKPGGRLIMTFPLSQESTIVSSGTARTYSVDSLNRFNNIAKPLIQDYYEYQHNQWGVLFIENKVQLSFQQQWMNRLKARFSYRSRKQKVTKAPKLEPRHPGSVTWRRQPLEKVNALNTNDNIEGVLCGVWRKEI